ncbi:hypothetical protein BH10PSE4_BH10PSE4_36580 [soil metagenome]
MGYASPLTVPTGFYHLVDPRRSRRGLTRIRGRVTDVEGQALTDCLVSNLSAFGVCMRVARVFPVHCDEIRLIMDGDDQLYRATVKWRDGAWVGVQLIDPV